MSKSTYALLFLLLCPIVACAQDKGSCVLDSASNGQTLSIRGKVEHNMHGMLLVVPGCKEVAVLIYAGEANSLHGVSSTRVTLPRETPLEDTTTLTLRKDREFIAFEKYTNAVFTSDRRNLCIACYKYEVEANFTGRLDVTKRAGFTRDDKTQHIISMDGFGYPKPFTRFRFVIESVSNVAARKLPKPGTDEKNARKSDQ